MQRIIYFLSSYHIGLTSLLVNYATALHKLAPDAFLFVCGEKEQFAGLFVKLENVSINPGIIHGLDDHRDIWRLVKEFRLLVEEYRPDVVHVQTNWQLAIAALVKFRVKYKYRIAYTIHGYRHNQMLSSVAARVIIGTALLCFADVVFAASGFVKEKFNFLGKTVKFLPLGVDDDFYRAADMPEFDSPKRLFFAGQFRHGKNQDWIIRAVHDYIAATGDRTIELYLPGEGDLRSYCMELAVSLGIRDNVIFPGQLDRQAIVTLLSKCQFAVIPANSETFGHCIAEPAVMGRVVITRPVGVAPDFIVDGDNGFYFDSEKDLLNVLNRALGDERLCNKISRNIRASAGLFRWDRICGEYLAIIRSLDVSRHIERDQERQPVVAVIWQRFLPYHRARIHTTAYYLEERGIKLLAIEVATQDTSYGFPTEDMYDIPPVHYRCCFPGQNYHNLSARKVHNNVLQLLFELMPDIVFAPATPFPEGMAAIQYRTVMNKKVVMMDDVWALTEQKSIVARNTKRLIHRNVDAVFIPAESHKSYVTGMGFSEDRTLCGVDVVDNDYFSLISDEARRYAPDVRARLELPKNYFLFVGRLIAEKGIDTLISAYKIYCSSVKDNPWHLVIVGPGRNTEGIKKIRAESADIHFRGLQSGDGLCSHYALAHVLVVPSQAEQWGLVINEGMACSLPVIASKGCGATATLVHDSDNGWTFEPGDAEELAKCMIDAHNTGSEKLAAMGARSRVIIDKWSTTLFAESVFQAMNIPRRKPAGFISNLATHLWKGHVRTY